MSSQNWGPSIAWTKEEHDLFLDARNGRPLTQDPMRSARTPDEAPGGESLIDTYIQPKGNP